MARPLRSTRSGAARHRFGIFPHRGYDASEPWGAAARIACSGPTGYTTAAGIGAAGPAPPESLSLFPFPPADR
jgi:hypothetical protein